MSKSKVNRELVDALKAFGFVLLVVGSCCASAEFAWSEPNEVSVTADAKTAQETQYVVARVNGDPVTAAELKRVLANPLEHEKFERKPGTQGTDSLEVQRLALQKLIHRRLILQEAGRRNLLVSEQDLDQAIISLRNRFDDLTALGMWMKQQGLDDQSLFDSLRANMLVARTTAAIVEDLRVTDEAVREYYAAHTNELITKDVWIQIIVIESRAAAEKIQAALRNGEDFGALAKERSLGRRAAQGGDMGWVNSETLWPRLREVVDMLEPGEAIGPVMRGDDEFLIVRLQDTRPGRIESLAEARPEIERRLLAAKQQDTIQAWLADHERKSEIEVFLPPD